MESVVSKACWPCAVFAQFPAEMEGWLGALKNETIQWYLRPTWKHTAFLRGACEHSVHYSQFIPLLFLIRSQGSQLFKLTSQQSRRGQIRWVVWSGVSQSKHHPTILTFWVCFGSSLSLCVNRDVCLLQFMGLQAKESITQPAFMHLASPWLQILK